MRLLRKPYKQENGLPLGYTEVEYLQSSGAQYINTGFTFDSTTDIIEIGYQNTSTAQHKWLFGSYESNANIGISSATITAPTFWYKGNIASTEGAQYNSEHILRYDSTGMSNDGVNLKAFTSYTGTWNIFLFALNNNGTSPNGYYGFGKIFYYKQIRNNELILHLIPALDISGRPCMYDLVERKPYYNLGTGNFTYGKKIIPVEYLESSGTQYINTGITTWNNTLEYEVKLGVQQQSGTRTYFGCYDSWNAGGKIVPALNTFVQSYKMQSNFDTGFVASSGTSIGIGNGQTGIISLKGNTLSWSEGSSLIFNRGDAFTKNDLPILLFGTWYSNGPKELASFPMYYAKFWLDDVLVRDYIPVKDENNVGYMFDKITHSLYANAGTGSFVVGKIKEQKIITKPAFLVSSELPIGFTEVEYIENTAGTWADSGSGASDNYGSYIDTGIHPNPSGKVKIGMMFNDWTGHGPYQAVFGGYDSNTKNFGVVLWMSGSHTTYFMDGNQQGKAVGDYTANTYYDFEYSAPNKTFTVNGVSNTFSVSGLSTKSDLSIYLFSNNAVGSGMTQYDTTYTTMGKIYYFKYFEGDKLVSYMIPCLDRNNVPCMYDKVRGTVYYNAGRGDFTVGPKIIPVEYIESSGTQWIDTDIVAKTGIKTELDFMWNSGSAGNTKYMFGTSGYYNMTLGTASSQWAYGSFDYFSGGTVADNTRYKVIASYEKSNQYVNVNGVNVITGTDARETDLGINLGIFCRKKTNTVEFLSSAKLYSCKIWNNNVIVRDYIPVKDENNVGYIFDKVSHRFFTNKGTGAFTIGEDKIVKKYIIRALANPSIIPNIYQKINYLESSGKQYIDTGYKPNNNTEYEVKGYMNPSGVFGVARWSGEPTYDTFGAHSITANALDYYGRYSDGKYAEITGIFNKQIIWKHTKTNISIIDADNGTSYVNQDILTGTFQSTYNMWLFGFNNIGTILSRSVGCKIYKFKIWENNNLVRDYIPVLRKSDNKPGMYDIITRTFYTNAGTGEFDYG